MTPKLLHSSLWQQRLGVLWWCFRKVPMLFWMTPKVLELNSQKCHLQVPLNWRTSNHVGSMYFGAMLSAADLVCGLLVLAVLESHGHKCRLLFKEVQGRFLKRPESSVEFRCVKTEKLEAQVAALKLAGDRAFLSLQVQAVCRDDVVGEFELEVALKKM